MRGVVGILSSRFSFCFYLAAFCIFVLGTLTVGIIRRCLIVYLYELPDWGFRRFTFSFAPRLIFGLQRTNNRYVPGTKYIANGDRAILI